MLRTVAIRALLFVSLTCCHLCVAFAGDDLFLQAEKALSKGQLERYQSLRQQLNQHPLAIYLDYHFMALDWRN